MVSVTLECFRERLPAASSDVLRAHPNVEKHDVRMGHPHRRRSCGGNASYSERRGFVPRPLKSDSKPAASSLVASKVAAIKSFRIVQEKDGPAVEILSTRPLVPSIQAISDPDRLVIDLPNARLETPQKRINVQADQISTIRADQFQQNPPVARVVVDLLAPRAYTWDAAGNRLVVHLGKNPGQANSSPFQAPTVPSLTPAPQPVVTAVRAAGPLALAWK